MRSNQVIAVAALLNNNSIARDAWEAWMGDIQTNGGEMDAAGARAFAEYLGDQRGPEHSAQARALRQIANAL